MISSLLRRACAVMPMGVAYRAQLVYVAALFLLLAMASPANAELVYAPLSNFTSCSDVTQIPEQECNALVALYNSASGAAWTSKNNWLVSTTPCDNWYGVSCIDPGGGQRVAGIVLPYNGLIGAIPVELGSLSSLQVLNLAGNQLSGSIPVELVALQGLQILNLSDNQLSGAIPSELGTLSNLEILHLYTNQLSGSVPAALGKLSSLLELYLAGNQLSGSIPSALGSLAVLNDLRLDNNDLSGNIPSSLGGLTQLGTLHVNDNPDLGGSLPSSFTNLSNLHTLNYMNTAVCTPTNTAFSAWLAGLWGGHISAGVSCRAILALTPVASTVKPGESVEVTIMVRTQEEVDAAAAYIDFDPAILQVTQLVPGTSLPLEIGVNGFDNVAGRIDYVAGKLEGELPSADFVLATVTFEAVDEGASELTLVIDTVSTRISDVTFAGESILSGREDSIITVEAPIPSRLLGTVTLPGRPAGPAINKQVPVTVTVTATDDTPQSEEIVTLDSEGRFTLTNVIVGEWLVGIKAENTLSTWQEVSIVPGDVEANFTLRGGDADGNDVVELVDFDILANTFARCSAAGDYDGRADFNGDQCVVLVDFSILRTFFGQVGGIYPMIAMSDARPSGSTAQIRLAAVPASLQVGDRVTLEIAIETGGGPVDAAAASLVFDPAVIRAVEVTAGGALPLELVNKVDAAAGRVTFAAGTFDALPAQDFVLARVEVEVIGNGATGLVFDGVDSGVVDITFGGESVLGGAVHGWLRAGNGPTVFLPTINVR